MSMGTLVAGLFGRLINHLAGNMYLSWDIPYGKRRYLCLGRLI